MSKATNANELRQVTKDFNFEGNAVRIVMRKHEPWFVAKDVCVVLGIGNPTEALRNLDEDEKSTLSIAEGIPGNPVKSIISESGLYSLIFRSRKKAARLFKRWVTHEVLPAIRKNGCYANTKRRIAARADNSRLDRAKELYGEFDSMCDRIMRDVMHTNGILNEIMEVSNHVLIGETPVEYLHWSKAFEMCSCQTKRGVEIVNQGLFVMKHALRGFEGLCQIKATTA